MNRSVDSMVIQRIIVAAREVQRLQLRDMDIPMKFAAVKELETALREFDKPNSAAESAYVAQATEECECDDVEIAQDARVSEADDGAWVQAWVWVYADKRDEP